MIPQPVATGGHVPTELDRLKAVVAGHLGHIAPNTGTVPTPNGITVHGTEAEAEAEYAKVPPHPDEIDDAALDAARKDTTA